MNKNMDKNKEGQILLEKNSECDLHVSSVFYWLRESKGLDFQTIRDNFFSNANVKYTVPVFCFMKSPDLDEDQK